MIGKLILFLKWLVGATIGTAIVLAAAGDPITIAWFIADYKRDADVSFPSRYCGMDDFTDLIRSEGGDWAEIEVLGNKCLVKVKATASVIDTVDNTYYKIPMNTLDRTLGDLTSAQRTTLRNKVLEMGYTTEEINARFPNLAQATLRDVLRFMATRRLKPRYDAQTDTIYVDGAIEPTSTLESIEERLP